MVVAAAQSPASGNIQHSKSGCRKPLEPKKNNYNHQTPNSKPNPKPKQASIEKILPAGPSLDENNNNKENIPPPPLSSPSIYSSVITPVKIKKEASSDLPFPIESLDASLADELSAIRQKLDRLRIDRENTEKMLAERALMLDLRMKDLIHRGDTQKQLEIELDRLYRLNEIKLASCLRRSPVRTLREKEQEKKMKQQHQLKANFTTDEEIKDLQEDNDEHSREAEEDEDTQSQAQIVNSETTTTNSTDIKLI